MVWRINLKMIIAILILAIFVSCEKDIDNLEIKGLVIEASDKKPIENVNVKVICWVYGDSPDGSYTKVKRKVIKTDENGKYSITFKHGAYIEVKVDVPGYESYHEVKNIYTSKNVFDIVLKTR